MVEADAMQDRRVAQVIPLEIPSDIKEKLKAAPLDLWANDLLILPSFRRDGMSFYGSGDVDSIRLAHDSGLEAAFLHGPDDREYLHEYSAIWALEYGISFAANISSVGIAAICSYMISRAGKAVQKGLHEGPAEKVPARITVATYHRSAEGELTIKGLMIEGPSDAAADAIRALVNQSGVLPGTPDPISIEVPMATLPKSEDKSGSEQ